MLTKLDRYILRKHMATFFFTLLLFSMIIIVVDISQKVDDFMEEKLGLAQIVFEYYVNFIPFVHGLLFPVYALIAVIFFTSRMAYNTEIVAILAAGVSFRRLMLPYAVGGAILGGLYLVFAHWLIPMGNAVLIPFENQYIYKYDQESKTNDIHIFLTRNSKAMIRHYSLRDSVARDMMIEEFGESGLKSRLTAKRADWDAESGRWELTNYTIRRFDGLKEAYEEGPRLDTLINLTPGDLERRDNLKTTMTSRELVAFLKSERQRGTGKAVLFEIELYNRTAAAFSIVLLTLIGMIVSSRKVRGGTGLHLAIGAALGATYIMLNQFSTTFSTSGGLPPVIGVWIPNLVFIGVTLFLISKAQK